MISFEPKTTEQLIHDNLIVKMLAGSHAYGTNIQTSDVDHRGIFVGDPINVRTPFFPIGEVEDVSEEDTKFYELTKFMKLAVDCNPNIVELLWTDVSDIGMSTPAYEVLRAAAPRLLSSKIAYTTSGYAMSQLKRLQTSKKKVNYLPDLERLCVILRQANASQKINQHFIETQCGVKVLRYMDTLGYALVQCDNQVSTLHQLFDLTPQPIDSATRMAAVCIPQHKDFLSFIQSFNSDVVMPRDFHIERYNTDHRLVPYGKDTYGIHHKLGYTLYSDTGSLNDCFEDSRDTYKTPKFILKFNAQEYSYHKNEYDKFWSWLENRNTKRLELEREFSYDSKHAMHLVRLLRMGVEALTTGALQVKRADAAELLDIRAGKWSYADIIKHAEELDRDMHKLIYTTQLPKEADKIHAAQLIITIQDMTWNTK